MKTLIINDELRNLLPPLSEEERAGLEASILKEGVLTPLIVWNDTLVDGHSRYDICVKHSIPFCVRNIEFDSIDEAKLWIWEHQKNRRNLTPYHRAEIALKLKGVIAAKAKERQALSRSRKGSVKGKMAGESIDTRRELENLACVSHNTLDKVQYLIRNADDATKNRLRRGEKGTSINNEYNRLKAANAQLPDAVTPSATSGQKIIYDSENGMLLIRRDTTPRELATFIVEHFPATFVHEFLRCLMKEYGNRYGNETIQHFLLKNCVDYID